MTGSKVDDALTVDLHPAAVDTHQADEAAEHRGLARAAGPDDDHDLTLRDLQVDVVEDHVLPEPLADVDELDGGRSVVGPRGQRSAPGTLMHACLLLWVAGHDTTPLTHGSAIGRRMDSDSDLGTSTRRRRSYQRMTESDSLPTMK